MSFLQRRFSLNLALRYLNPVRTHFSIISLICLVGVSLGVMVLIVVLSVMGGLQKELKGRFLTYTPHLTVAYSPMPGVTSLMKDWREVVVSVKKDPDVVTAYPQIEDYALIDVGGAQKPSFFRAIDTENESQMEELRSMLKDGSFDMGMGEEAVISSNLAESMGVSVGDVLRIYAKRNYEDVIAAYRRSEHSLKSDSAEELSQLIKILQSGKEKEKLYWLPKFQVEQVLSKVNLWMSQKDIRKSEWALLNSFDALSIPKKENKNDYGYNKDLGKDLVSLLEQIKGLDTEKEDLDSFKEVKSLVLPRDLEVVGIYQASRHVSSPEIFLPLNIGQEILGYEDCAQGVAVRVKDPYDIKLEEKSFSQWLPPIKGRGAWTVRDWMNNPAIATWVTLMSQERVMISFVLFFITLVSAFCIMAVMFAMSIQRKKELAVMRALGATPLQVVRVFLWQGVLIGCIGSILGIVLGFAVLYYRIQIRAFLVKMNFDPFPTNFHGVEIPCLINANEIVLVSVLAFVLVVLASIIPAIISARQDPAKSLRSL